MMPRRFFLPVFCAAGMIGGLPAAFAQTNVGAYFSFQTLQAATNYSEAVSVSTFPGTPVFARTGSALATFDNFGANFTAFDGSVWVPGKCATWNAASSGGSTNNSWQVTLNTTSVTGLAARFKYRLNGVKSGGTLVTSLAAFEYQIGAGPFQPVPGVSLTLANNSDYNNIWTANLIGLTNIENQASVTLRWRLPNLDEITSTQVRMDDLQITGLFEATSGAPGRPRYLPVGNYNVLFIAVDDLKANFGPFGTPPLAPQMPVPVTPHLNALAASGMTFTRAYCQQAVCSPSRVSLLTGVRPDTAKVWNLTASFRDTIPNVITLPQHFISQGYRTAAHGKILHPGAPNNQDASNSWNDGQNTSSPAYKYYEDGHWQVESNTPAADRGSLFATDAGVTNYWVNPPRAVVNDDYVDGLVASRSIAQLQTYASNYLASGQRFFLAVGFYKPHLPFVCPKSFWDLYDPAQIDLTGYTGTRTMPTGTLPFTAPFSNEPVSYNDVNGTNTTGTINITDARRLIHGYLASTSFMDAQLGRLLAALDASGVASNTIVVLWGDHGWHLGDHNGFWSKHSNFEQAAQSPLIIRAPGMGALGTAGTKCYSPVELVDLFPTLVDLASLPSPAQPAGLEMQGASLRPLLEDPAQPWKKGAFSQYNRWISSVPNPGNGMGYSIRTSRYRYTEWWRTQTSATNAQGEIIDRHVKLFGTPEHRELYDMVADPGETINRAAEPAYASLVAELSAALAGGYGWSNAAVAVPATYPTNYAAWQSAHVEPGYAITNFADALDIDGDAIPNVEEYVLGTHPLYPDPNWLWSGVVNLSGTRHLALEYPRINARTDVGMQALTSTNLASWSTNGVTNELLNTQAERSRWRSRIPIDGAASRSGYLRLKIER